MHGCHPSAEAKINLTEVQLPAPVLERLAGKYTAKDKMVLAVKPDGNHLMVNAGGAIFELIPMSETSFFMKKREIQVTFSVNQNGKGQGLVVRERGNIVAAATASNPLSATCSAFMVSSRSPGSPRNRSLTCRRPASTLQGID